MKTIVYITRHSKPFRDLIGNYDVLEEWAYKFRLIDLSAKSFNSSINLSSNLLFPLCFPISG